MHKMLLAVSLLAMTLASVSAAQADIRLRHITCPFPADAAFKIIGAKGELDGVGAEYEWMALERPGWARESQATLNDDNKIYDMLTIKKGRNTERICFDITDFFGKMD